MRDTDWTPSIVPGDEDRDVCLVVSDFGGRAWCETDVEATDLETVIRDLLDGQYWTPSASSASIPARAGRATSQLTSPKNSAVLGVDGVPDFNALHSRKHDEEVQLYAFDILTLDGEDLRPLPLSLRKTNLARLLARRPDGIFVAPFEQGEIGLDLFRAACNMGLEGLVSKRVDRP